MGGGAFPPTLPHRTLSAARGTPPAPGGPAASGLTGHVDRGPRIDDPAVGPHAVPARCCGLHFETHAAVRRVAKLQVGGDDVREGACGGGQRLTGGPRRGAEGADSAVRGQGGSGTCLREGLRSKTISLARREELS